MFKEVKKKAVIWLHCFYLSVKSQYQYKYAFLLRCLVMFLTYFCEFITTWFLISKFTDIGEWTTVEIMLTYGLATLAYSLSRFVFNGFNSVSRQIKDGSFFMNMIRPFNEKFCIMAHGVPLERCGQIILGLAIIIYVYFKLAGSISLLGLILFIINGTILYGGLFILSAAVSFWVVESRELTGLMTHGTLRAIVYPLSIYKKIVRELMTYIIPVGFISYYPAMIMLGKTYNHIIIIITPFVGIFILMFSLLIWKIGIKKYEGSGG